MINFNEEIKKFKPALELEDIEDSINSDEVKDLKDLLLFLSEKITRNQG